MKDAEIEETIYRWIREAEECVRDLNDSGHEFVADEDAIFEWVDAAAGKVLEINCVLGVSVAPGERSVPVLDPEVEEYLAIAESGSDPVAIILNELEGDVANGGFMQLRDNKRLDFFREALRHLEAIGATVLEGHNTYLPSVRGERSDYYVLCPRVFQMRPRSDGVSRHHR